MIEQIIIASLCITFIHVCFWDGMILGKLRAHWLSKLPSWIRKPLYECLICMSVWYAVIYGAFVIGTPSGYSYVITFIFAVAGLNTIIYGIIGNAEDYNGEKFVNDGGGISGSKYAEIEDSGDMFQP